MKVLVACEFSGTVRDAFASRGHDAWSCDLLPSERLGNHMQGDVLTILDDGWDLMIAHPPCTYLTTAGNAWLSRPGRAELREEALAFFLALAHAPIPRVCVENPSGVVSTRWRRPDQTVNPYYFGDPHRKRTCLWLRGLRRLWWSAENSLFGPATAVDPPPAILHDANGKARHYTDAMSPGPNRWRERSRTFQGIADAMADQWGSLG